MAASLLLFGVASDSRAEPVENGIGELGGAGCVDVMAGGDGEQRAAGDARCCLGELVLGDVAFRATADQ